MGIRACQEQWVWLDHCVDFKPGTWSDIHIKRRLQTKTHISNASGIHSVST